MQRFTLEQAFGKGATQDVNFLTIPKTSLPRLTPTANNTAESLLVGIILQVYQHFEGELTAPSEVIIRDAQGRAITYNNSRLYEKLVISYWKRQYLQEDIRNLILDTFVTDIFISPPTEPGTELLADSLNY